METNEPKKPGISKVLLGVAGIAVIVAGVLIFSMLGTQRDKIVMDPVKHATTPAMTFDFKGAAVFDSFDKITDQYRASVSNARNLEEYYSRRQYPGSPPIIPHPLIGKDGLEKNCLSCHEQGGWTAELKRFAPVTPHPEYIMCVQCHVKPNVDDLFVESNWHSMNRPRLGRSALPGSPPPFPHELQLRENCNACHVGPGAVTEIRVEHPSRGVCRQCHVPAVNIPPFKREL
jgi:nitrate reductase (cytochrome), electron transfer subunit